MDLVLLQITDNAPSRATKNSFSSGPDMDPTSQTALFEKAKQRKAEVAEARHKTVLLSPTECRQLAGTRSKMEPPPRGPQGPGKKKPRVRIIRQEVQIADSLTVTKTTIIPMESKLRGFLRKLNAKPKRM
jgi:hypothetical protein